MLLVVSCPCALVISTPVSIVAALAGAARKGVLIKGGVHLERASRVRCVAFDKTGTLTRGAPEVVDVVALERRRRGRRSSALAASVEQRSTHPIAQAILEHAVGGRHRAVAGGRGVGARRAGRRRARRRRTACCSATIACSRSGGLCSPAIHERLDGDRAPPAGPPCSSRATTRPIGIIAVADRPRESGKDAIDLLRAQGVERIVMLTGDSHGTAKAIAAELGVDEFRAELLPEDKVAAVEELRRAHGSVAMVGDGVNDAPALASADVGIAMGAAGSDAALETADVALMADELLKIPYAFRLSRATVRNIKDEPGDLGRAEGGVRRRRGRPASRRSGWRSLADTGASIIVIANALRLLRAD